MCVQHVCVVVRLVCVCVCVFDGHGDCDGAVILLPAVVSTAGREGER